MEFDREHVNDLLDFYGPLLTSHQRDVLEEYYKEDLSMKEIAENYEISKAAISDLIKRTLAQLQDYEKKLHHIAQFEKIEEVIEEMKGENDERFKAYAIRLDRINRG